VRGRQVIAGLSTALTIAVSVFLWHHLPANTDVYAPFDVPGELGEQTAGRGLSGTVESATVTPRLTRPGGKEIAATGTWVIVDGVFQAGVDYGLANAELLVGGNQYRPTDRLITIPPQLQPGISDRRGWVFDVAPEILDSVRSVVFRIWVGDGRLDSRLVVDIPLDDSRVQHSTSVLLADPSQEAA
jgi:hypothetical protein